MSTPTPKAGFVSLECPKALADSGRILARLRMESYEVVPTYEDAGVMVVNICGFIDSAKAGFLEMIDEAIAENGRIIVTDCMGVERHTIRGVHPGVLAVTDPQRYEQVVTAMHEVVPPKTEHNLLVGLVPPQGTKLTPRHYVYLKISEGYSRSCSSCIIPSICDRLVSQPADDALNGTEYLVKARVKELSVISQDINVYSIDLKCKVGFWNSQPVKTRMKELCKAPGSMDVWVRLRHVYLYLSVDDMIPLMVAGKLLSYLDVPSRHASLEVLKAVKYPALEDRTLARIKQWHETCPELTIRLTFIIDFPGETEKGFQCLLDWLTEAQLDRVGHFQYSPVEGVPTNELDLEPMSNEVKQDRWERFMAHQQVISTARLQFKVGKEVEMLTDEVDEQSAIGRSWTGIPEIDNNMSVDSDELKPGDKIRVRIADADEHDLWAELI